MLLIIITNNIITIPIIDISSPLPHFSVQLAGWYNFPVDVIVGGQAEDQVGREGQADF